MNDRHDVDLGRRDQIEHTDRESPHTNPAQATVQLAAKEGEFREPFVDDVELVQELTTKPRALFFVPRECSLDIALGLRPNANTSSHRLGE